MKLILEPLTPPSLLDNSFQSQNPPGPAGTSPAPQTFTNQVAQAKVPILPEIQVVIMDIDSLEVSV